MNEFDACERRWALHYLWYDFDYFDFPDPLKRDCQFHAKLMGNEAFAGQVVHDAIDAHFRSKKEGKLLFGGLPEAARTIAREYAEDSKTFLKAFQGGDKAPSLRRQPLMRHFFGEGYDGSAKADFRKVVETALYNFENSRLHEEIQSHDPAFWELPAGGGAPWYMDLGIPVYANYDFALRTPERTIIYDWKTGKLSPAAERDVKEQLHTYAAYAIETWRVPPEQIKLRAVWLTVGPDQFYETGVDQGLLRLMRAEWRRRFEELRDRREKARGNMQKLYELFPPTGVKKKECKSCPFRFCEGYGEYLAMVRPEEPAGV